MGGDPHPAKALPVWAHCSTSWFRFAWRARRLDGAGESVRSAVIGWLASTPPMAAISLLVAEDREENRQLLVKLLTRWGFEVRSTVNGWRLSTSRKNGGHI
jgi:hypothetical protein